MSNQDKKVHEELVNAFLNCTLDMTKLRKKKPPPRAQVNAPPIPEPQEEPAKTKKEFSGVDYAKKFQHDLILKSKPSSLNSSFDVSGPTHQTPSTFVEDPSDVETIVGPAQTVNTRKSLPIFAYRQEIVQNIKNHPVTIIQGATGCGKTTQVPQYIYDDCAISKMPCNVIISQPRKIAALTIAHRVANERGMNIGYQVGYQISLDKCTGKEDSTQITFCTTGVVLQKLITAKSMNAYTHVIIDEVHERSVETDLLMTIIRRFLHLNSPRTKVILMSATMDASKFRDFFKIPFDGEYLYPPVIDLAQNVRRFPIKEFYIEDVAMISTRECLRRSFSWKKPEISEKFYDGVAKLLAMILMDYEKQNNMFMPTILVFLPGLNEIETLKTFLGGKFFESLRHKSYEIHILHSMMSTEDQKAAFVVSEKQKIILATNIAESSITIPNVTHVVDFCLTKRTATGGSSNRLQTLVLDWATKNNCQQRAGRTGRVCKGEAYRLVPRDFYETRIRDHPTPEILNIPLESVILHIKKLDMGPPCEILALSLDPPDMKRIVDAVLVLKETGALLRVNSDGIFEYDDGEISFVGEIMAALPLDVRLSKLIIMGYIFSCLEETIIIAAGLSTQGIFRKFGSNMSDYKTKVEWAKGSQSDLIATLNAYRDWLDHRAKKFFVEVGSEAKWCYRKGLDLKNLNEMRLLIAEIQKRLEVFKICELPRGHQPLWDRDEKMFALKLVIAGSFGVGNFAIPTMSINCEKDAFNISYGLDPKRTVYFRNMPKDIIGCVYERDIIEKFIETGVCDEKTKISVSFDLMQSERVFATFGDGADDKIPQEVHNAIKYRRLFKGIEINRLDEEQEKQLAVDFGFGKIENNKFEAHSPFMREPGLCALPTCFETSLRGCVTHVVSCGKFFLRPFVARGPYLENAINRHGDNIKELKSFINTTAVRNIEQSEVPKKNDLVVVIYEEELARGFFLQKKGDKFLVHLIDFGFDFAAEFHEMFIIKDKNRKEQVLKYSPRVFECRLQEIKPSFLKSFKDDWHPDATEQFKKAVLNKNVSFEVFSVVEDVVIGRVFSDDEYGNPICWNDKLLSDGFAEECEEVYVSKVSYSYREYCRNTYAENIYGPDEEFKGKKETMIHRPECPQLVRSKGQPKGETFFLKGPMSPLEIPLSSPAQFVNGFVDIDGTSVNQVILIESFQDFRPRLCVAAEMYCGPDNEKVKLRETTLLPNITGLPTILAMIFCPTAQIRRNSEKTRYTSILYGLGADENNLAHFFDRDSVLHIDFDLKQSDINAINNLRFLMSKLLYVEPFKNMRVPDLTDGQRENMLKKIKDQIMKIVTEKRAPRELDEDPTFEWNYNEEDVEHPSAINRDTRNIYEFLVCPPLIPMTRENKIKMAEHIKDLEEYGGRGAICQSNQYCQLCKIFWGNGEELKLHTYSKLHKTRKQQLINSLSEEDRKRYQN